MSCPEPGIYPNIPMSEYLSWDAINSGAIARGMKSLAHMKAYLDSPPGESSAAMSLGSAVHAAILEPDQFLLRYVIKPETYQNSKGEVKELTARSREGKEYLAQLGREHELLSAKDYALCLGMRDSVHAHPTASRLLKKATGTEMSIVWKDDMIGLRCKGRIDSLSDTCLVDLKSARDASPAGFQYAAAKYGHFRQLAFYVYGMGILTRKPLDVYIIAVENVPPHCVCVYAPNGDDLMVGHEEAIDVLCAYGMARMAGGFGGYSDDIEPLSLPAWALPDEESEEPDAQS